jgi:hypothetical protein
LLLAAVAANSKHAVKTLVDRKIRQHLLPLANKIQK